MKPSPSQLAFCLAQLTRFIPPPPRPKVELQKSKWGLKVGDLLRGGEQLWTVSQTDSLGITLEGANGKEGLTARIEEREALESYHKQPRPRAKGKKKQQPSLPGCDEEGSSDGGTTALRGGIQGGEGYVSGVLEL